VQQVLQFTDRMTMADDLSAQEPKRLINVLSCRMHTQHRVFYTQSTCDHNLKGKEKTQAP